MGEAVQRRGRWWLLVVPALVVLVAYPWILRSPYYHVLGFNVLMTAVMATGWNILGGYAGYKSLGHSVFFGIGAYATALAAVHLGWNPMFSAPVIAIGVAAFSLFMGWITLRASGSAFVIATIAMLLIVRILALNLKGITNGSPGLSQPLPPWSPEFSRMPFYYYMLVFLVIAVAVSSFVKRSRFGLGLQAIRDDEGKAEMVGVATMVYKVLAFGIAAYFMAVAGGIWSYSTTHISPPFTFDILTDVDVVLASMLGGLGTVFGPVLGAFILIPGRDLVLFKFGASQIHLAVFGIGMIAIIALLPRGILPTVRDMIASRRPEASAYAEAQEMAALTEAAAATAAQEDMA